MLLIKNANVYSPKYIGKKDILISKDKIYKIENEINIQGIEIEIIDAKNKLIVPGFIDNHVHIIGGGGEGGFKTRTPEIQLSNVISSGVTTIIGCLGTDGTTRTMPDLLAKCKALNEEGISCYILTGSYQIPIITFTKSIRNDIIFINEIIGTGEIAVSDHRSSHPTYNELVKIFSDTRVAGLLSGKPGIINIHMGGGKSDFQLLHEIVEKTEIPITQFIPTHCNRNIHLLNESMKHLNKGGYIDFTSSTSSKEEDITSCSKSMKYVINNGGSIDKITFSSDGQGSLPIFDQVGNYVGLGIGKIFSLYEEFVKCVVKEKFSIEDALKPLTSNVSKAYKLKEKGEIKNNFDADLVILDERNLDINTVICKGEIMLKNKEFIKKGTFE